MGFERLDIPLRIRLQVYIHCYMLENPALVVEAFEFPFVLNPMHEGTKYRALGFDGRAFVTTRFAIKGTQ